MAPPQRRAADAARHAGIAQTGSTGSPERAGRSHALSNPSDSGLAAFGLLRLDAPPPFALWQADLARTVAESELQQLSEAERDRVARFVFAADRRRYAVAHLALRRLLAACTGQQAQALRLATGPFGKPLLASTPACAFNLSHSGDLAWIAVAEGDDGVGVDVELLRPVADAAALAQRHFTPAECAALDRAPADQRDRHFLRGWTRKEACLKALGSGLSIAPESFEAGLQADAVVLRIVTADGEVAVQVQSLEGAGGNVVGALARVLPD